MTTPAMQQINDHKWVRQSFMLSAKDVSAAAQRWRSFTTASQKFTSSRLGCNWAINSPPQRTRYADIRNSGKLSEASYNFSEIAKDGRAERSVGMGRWYSEAIDDQGQLVHMQFGVPEFNGMTTFFTSFYDSGQGLLANEGRSDGLFFTIGKVIGLVVTLPFWVYIGIGKAVKYALNTPSSKYYYMKPTMANYWNRVNYISNTLGVNMGIVPRVYDTPYDATLKEEGALSPEHIAWFTKRAPGIINANGSIDMYEVANKAQRLANKRYDAIAEITTGANNRADARTKVIAFMEERKMQDPGSKGIEAYLKKYYGIDYNQPSTSRQQKTDEYFKQGLEKGTAALKGETAIQVDASADVTTGEAEGTADASITKVLYRPRWEAVKDPKPGQSTFDKVLSYFGAEPGSSPMGELLTAEKNDGSQFITWRVDATGEVGESFSNSFGDSSIAGKMNGMATTGRSMQFDFSGGNTGIGIIDSAVEAVTDLAKGALQGVGMSGLMQLAGSAFVDIPQVWQSSSSTFPSQTFTMQLRSVYGNRMNRYMYMYVPLAMIMAAALPLSTGTQSYTSPFLCSMWSRGRQTIRLGMIDSLSISRGVGTMGWNNENEALGIDITFTVKDLSTVMHAPIGQGYTALAPLRGLFDDDNAFSDYLGALGNLSMADQTQTMRRLSIALTRQGVAFNSYWSKSHYANAFGSSFVGRVLAAVSRDSERLSK